MYLHYDASYRTYVDFFTELWSAIDADIVKAELRLSSTMVLGSDEEKGLTKALRDVFKDSTHLLCVKHLKDNVTNYMRNRCGVNQLTRGEMLEWWRKCSATLVSLTLMTPLPFNTPSIP